MSPIFGFFKIYFVSSCLLFTQIQRLVFWFVEATGQTAFAAVMSVKGLISKIYKELT